MLNYKEKKDQIRYFMNKYSWEGMNYPSEKDDWKKFEKHNLKIALTVFQAKNEKNTPTNVSKLSLYRRI